MDFENCDEGLAENDDLNYTNKRLLRKQTIQTKQLCAKDERNATIKRVSLILQKIEDERTPEDVDLLNEYKDVVDEVKSRWKKRDEAKRRLEEFEEPCEKLREKCVILAQAIAQSQHLVVYTGAGISTAARIPDYRGTNGIWTRLQQGKDIGNHDLSLAEPTYTHMALSELYKRNILKYVVSQNCDGLHLRSGLPKTAISEVHGNMYVEVCKVCKPSREYWRLFDVTENTARYSHKTLRKCYTCNNSLIDTIVHFGERGSLQWPLNWSGASKNARKATTILCLGSSLKVLKKYPWLWQMHKPVKRRPNLYIVNLQWTPKDDCANVKINGKCDEVMKIVMELLGITVPNYEREKDPIFVHGSVLCEQEVHTTNQPFLKYSESQQIKEVVKRENSEGTSVNFTNKDLRTRMYSDSEQLDHDENCDTTKSNIYSINKVENIPTNGEPAVLPKTNTHSITSVPHSHLNMFSIDNILSKQTSEIKLRKESLLQSNLLLNQNCQALLTYYQISNSILQNQMLAYTNSHYPFQTSFLYSGLHSIINPIPIIKEEHNYYNTYRHEEKFLPVKEEIVVPKCEYCHDNYKSSSCLFYEKYEPKFIRQQYRYSKIDNIDKPLYCICCDYTTDEDDDMEKLDEHVSPDKICRISSEQENNEQKVKIQPGWFGKGYRKNKKYKKKVTS